MLGRFDVPSLGAPKFGKDKPDFLRDFMASIVVFLVALPLCLGIAIACGAPPALGIITGIIGGLIVGVFSGSPLQVSGPAAGLVAIVADIISEHHLAGLGVVIALAGLIQLTAGGLKLGQWFRAISPAVIQGMLAGIGVLIVASQFHVMLDVTPESGGLQNIISIPGTIMKGLFPINESSHHLAAMLGTISMVILIAWNFIPKRLKLIPGTLVAVVTAVATAALLQLPVKYVQVPQQFWSELTFPDVHSLALLQNPDIWILAVTVAVVASAETMLSAAALDKMVTQMPSLTGRPVKTNYDKEMLAQGIGNTLCGLLGALPLTGVIVRSSANIQAGAVSRYATMFHGLWLLALVSIFPAVLGKIPTASLAAILVYTGYKLVQPAAIKQLWQVGKSEVLIYLVTLVMVVGTNLLEGVIVGSILAMIKLLVKFSHLEGKAIESGEQDIDLFLKGSATFLSLPRLVQILEEQPAGRRLVVHIETLSHLDHACVEVLQNWEQQYAQSGGSLTVAWHQMRAPKTERESKPTVLV